MIKPIIFLKITLFALFLCSCNDAAWLKIDKQSYMPNEMIQVNYQADVAFDSSAWIGIVPKYVAHGSEYVSDLYDISFVKLNGQLQGLIMLPAPPTEGTYQVRMFDSDTNGKEQAYQTFEVKKQ